MAEGRSVGRVSLRWWREEGRVKLVVWHRRIGPGTAHFHSLNRLIEIEGNGLWLSRRK